MPIFQGFWKDKEKEEDGFLFPIPLLLRWFLWGKKTLKGRGKTSFLDTFFILFYVRVAKTNF